MPASLLPSADFVKISVLNQFSLRTPEIVLDAQIPDIYFDIVNEYLPSDHLEKMSTSIHKQLFKKLKMHAPMDLYTSMIFFFNK